MKMAVEPQYSVTGGGELGWAQCTSYLSCTFSFWINTWDISASPVSIYNNYGAEHNQVVVTECKGTLTVQQDERVLLIGCWMIRVTGGLSYAEKLFPKHPHTHTHTRYWHTHTHVLLTHTHTCYWHTHTHTRVTDTHTEAHPQRASTSITSVFLWRILMFILFVESTSLFDVIELRAWLDPRCVTHPPLFNWYQ